MSRQSKAQKETVDNTVILERNMEDVMHDSMMPYSEHVILERAVPRVEDGLKPVQRRVLFAMNEAGLTPDKPFRKSANIVGETMAKYHPHGDSSIYDTMVRLAQDFNMRVPLVEGNGNFGSMDGDAAAAFRYTEARMAPAALMLMRDLAKETVPSSLNFDDTRREPDVLPALFPNLLINGSAGIAVGLATNVPPHTPDEVIDGVIAAVRNPKITLEGLMKHIKGPDFPTGGIIVNPQDLPAIYATGEGILYVRAKAEIEKLPDGKSNVVITEFPFQSNKAELLAKVLEHAQSKREIIQQISDVRDESDRTGIRAVIEV
ncbi:MAG: DNA gyrase subunit A, partial [Clostridia bacterium]|nr:DNA gyrase subunit A [Clostridia bacterium]